jgi:hypothetical protein
MNSNIPLEFSPPPTSLRLQSTPKQTQVLVHYLHHCRMSGLSTLLIFVDTFNVSWACRRHVVGMPTWCRRCRVKKGHDNNHVGDMSGRHVADISATCRVSAFSRLFADTTWPTYPTKGTGTPGSHGSHILWL